MSAISQMIRIAAIALALSAVPAVAQQQATPPGVPAPPAAATPPAPAATPVDEATMSAELKRLYTFPVLANECEYTLSDAEFVRLDSAIGLAEERSGFPEEKLDELFNGVESALKEDLFKKGQEAACKEQEAAFKAFVTGLPD